MTPAWSAIIYKVLDDMFKADNTIVVGTLIFRITGHVRDSLKLFLEYYDIRYSADSYDIRANISSVCKHSIPNNVTDLEISTKLVRW